MNIVTKQKSRT